MDRPKIRDTKGPEEIIQEELVKYLRLRKWFVKETHGNLFQSGFPDLYCVHKEHGQRWIEVKNPEHYRFTPAQLDDFPEISKVVGIWILVAATDSEYQKLWEQQNWWKYLPVNK